MNPARYFVTRVLPTTAWILLVLFFTGGCATTSFVEFGPKYAPPPAGPNVATITGSRLVMFDIILLPSWRTVYVSAVDQLPVPAGKAGWNTALNLTPGPHTLTVAYDHLSRQAFANFPINVAPGSRYVVKFATDAIYTYASLEKHVDLWLVDAVTQKNATAVARQWFAPPPADVYVDTDDNSIASIDVDDTRRDRRRSDHGSHRDDHPHGGDHHEHPGGDHNAGGHDHNGNDHHGDDHHSGNGGGHSGNGGHSGGGSGDNGHHSGGSNGGDDTHHDHGKK